MSGSSARDLLAEVVEPVVTAAGLDLEGLEVASAGRRQRIRLLVDKDGGVTLDECAEISRLVEPVLDASPVLDDTPYTLEVSSPGVARPLTLPRHWRRATGRLVAVTLRDGSSVTGRVRAATDDDAELAVGERVSKVRYSEVAKAKVQVEFTRSGNDRADDGQGE